MSTTTGQPNISGILRAKVNWTLITNDCWQPSVFSHWKAASSYTIVERNSSDSWLPAIPGTNIAANSPFCNVTWDAILCWPLIPVNRTIRLPCPLPPGLNQGVYAERHCRQKGHQRNDGQLDLVSWSDYSQCYSLGQGGNDGSYVSSLNRIGQHDETWLHASADVETSLLESVSAIQRGAGQLEIIGLLISICAICVTLYILHRFGRLTIPENMARPHLLVSTLLLGIANIIVLFDASLSTGESSFSHEWCQVWYFLIEFFKSCLNFWFLFRCMAMLCEIIISCSRKRALKDCPYLFSGWLTVAPIMANITWVARLISGYYTGRNAGRCPEMFYSSSDYWSVLLPQLITLFLAAVLLIVGLVILGCHFHKTQSEVHVGGGHLLQDDQRRKCPAEYSLSASIISSTILGGWSRQKRQVSIEFAVLVMLAFPFALRMFFYAPNLHNMHLVGSLHYAATFFAMFQGLFISMLYGFAQVFIPVCGSNNPVVLRKYERVKLGE